LYDTWYVSKDAAQISGVAFLSVLKGRSDKTQRGVVHLWSSPRELIEKAKSPRAQVLEGSIGDKGDTLARQRSRLGKSTTVSLARVPPVIITSRVEEKDRERKNEGNRQ
jgi:hypothetical protein